MSMYENLRGNGATQNRHKTMSESLKKLISAARTVRMSEPQKQEQRVSFAYGTANIENENVTREMVEEAAKESASKAQ